ncbi:MAG: hypothetical protein IJT50_11730, partial [Lentisphaeria bacterium]|nr:hypothetical protein [Lentisphaeria bacterium]
MEYTITEKTGAAIQQAVDRAAAAGGGKVILSPGVYPSGTIRLTSNIELHIPAGAVILGLPDPEAYDDFRHPELDAVAPEKSRKCLIACADCENVSVTGDGRIDGSGLSFFDRSVPAGQPFAKPPVPRPRMIQFHRCRNLTFKGPSFIDSPNWTFWLSECEDVNISRIRIAGCKQICNNDGIDIDSCRRVHVSDCSFSTGDDCLILRAIRKSPDRPAVCEEIFVTDCSLDSRCQGIRLGCPSDDTIRNATFRNITFNGSGSGIHCEAPLRYLRKNCTGYLDISDILFENFDITTGRCPVRIACDPGIRLRAVRRFTFRNFRIKSQLPISLEGSRETILED